MRFPFFGRRRIPVKEQRGDNVLFGLPYTGKYISEEGALNISAVYGCVRIISSTLASLPLGKFERLERGKRQIHDNDTDVLTISPNGSQTSFQWREYSEACTLLWGNAYAEKEKTKGGGLYALHPIHPSRVRPYFDGAKMLYEIEGKTFARDTILHIPGFSMNGYIGQSVISYARNAVSLGATAEEYGSKFFANDARPGVVLKHPGKLGDDAHKRLIESWNQTHKSSSRSHKVALLEEGLDVETIGIPPEDAQFLETRKFQIADIARFFSVPLHMLAELDKSSFNNIEQQSLEFVTHTMRPWLVRWEQILLTQLMSREERNKYFYEFNIDGLLRGDIAARYTAYATGRQWGWLSANDIREKENQNPIDGGDVYLTPMNMASTQGGANEK